MGLPKFETQGSTQILIRLPDDGTGVLPLLRHIILNDNKSSTYKLALLRTLCWIADGYLGMVRETEDEAVEIPHGLFALFWIRQFKPLLDLKIPQSPSNDGYRGSEFAKGSLALLMVSPLDSRISRFVRLDARSTPPLDRARSFQQLDRTRNYRRMGALHPWLRRKSRTQTSMKRRSERLCDGPILSAMWLWPETALLSF
jgi:hypothetical protein